MTKPQITIFDVTTQEEIVREMTEEEYAHYLTVISVEEPTE